MPDRPSGSTAPTAPSRADAAGALGAELIETVVSPFHCLYQDGLWFHTQSQLRASRSESEASRLARGAFLSYIAAAEALAHQAAAELGRPDVGRLACDPGRPLPLAEVWRLLPSLCDEGEAGFFDPALPPWPQFEELLELHHSWRFPGAPHDRRAYYRPGPDGGFEPVEAHQVPPAPGIEPSGLFLPRTGLPRDPYALRPRHLDTARAVLDAAVAALDRRMAGALTRDARHRREPLRKVAAGSVARNGHAVAPKG
jgi:hypothetical protein